MIQDVGKEIAELIGAYTEDVKKNIADVSLEVTLDTIQILKDTSPKNTGEYAKGWGRNKQRDGSYIVSQKKKPGLTHLLEKGHAKVTGGRVEGQSHIEPAEQFAIDELERRIVDAIERSGG